MEILQARRLCSEVQFQLRRERPLPGPNHPHLADVLENLAGFYKDQGRNADAQAFLKRSMAIRKAGSRPI